VLPLVALVVVAGAAFTLAELHPAKPEATATTSVPVVLGDASRGQTLFAQRCAPCHGVNGRGGGIGPKLAGASIALAEAEAKIDTGSSVMPPKIVTGAQERDVLAYLATILANRK
jgi:mono/diheme cytochrome c family protein